MGLERKKEIGSAWATVHTEAPGGGSQTIETIVQEISFEDFVKQEGDALSWEGAAPYMTIQPSQVVLECFVFVTEEFDDTASMREIQVTNDPESASTQLSANAPDPQDLNILDGVVVLTDSITPAHNVPYSPLAPLTPVVAVQGFNGDGTQGKCLIFTTIYTPSS